MNKDILQRYGQRVGYSQDDLAHIGPTDHRARHISRLAKAAPLYSIVAEVISSQHCNSGHKVGDRLVLDVDGNLISKLCPKRICVYLASQLTIPVAQINERLGAGLEPGDFHFMRQLSCPDLGVECQGYGRVIMQVKVVPRGEVAG